MESTDVIKIPNEHLDQLGDIYRKHAGKNDLIVTKHKDRFLPITFEGFVRMILARQNRRPWGTLAGSR